MGGRIYQFDSGRNERAFYIVEKVMGMMYMWLNVYGSRRMTAHENELIMRWQNMIKWRHSSIKVWMYYVQDMYVWRQRTSLTISYVYTCLQFRRCREIEWFSCCLVGGLRWLRCGQRVDSVLPSESVGVKPWNPTEQDKSYCYRRYRNRRDRLTILSTILLLRGFCSKNK